MAPLLRIAGLCKGYASKTVLEGLDLEIGAHEFVTVFGPNGCGKSTMLRLVAGLEATDSGRIEWAEGAARIGFVFQNYRDSLLPWKTAEDNVAFPLVLRGEPKAAARERARALLASFSLAVPPRNYPYQLSGGQQQLVAIARALVTEPPLVLMDEPFSALDYQTRLAMQDQLAAAFARTRASILFVSHEVEEAVYLADRIAVFTPSPGRVAEWIPVSLARPRHQSLRTATEFLAPRRRLLELLEPQPTGV